MRQRLTSVMVGLGLAAGFLAMCGESATVRAMQGGGQGAPRGGGRGGIVTLAVMSTSFPDGGEIPAKYTGASGVSPQLSWTGVPASTASFVLIMHDVDVAVPAGSLANDITHWVVWNIPAATTTLPEGGPLPQGASQLSMRGPQYMGPAPPAGHPYHHYVFQVFALNSTLEVPAGATRADVEKAMEGKILARGTYVGRAKSQQ